MTKSIGLAPALVDYINAHNPDVHPVLTKCEQESQRRYPDDFWFQISQEQAAFMQMLIRLTRSKRILEIGAFNGYSAIAFALAAQQLEADTAKVVSIEKNKEWSANANEYIAEAGLSHVASVIEGDALIEAERLVAMRDQDYDFCFIDADKRNTSKYLETCYRGTRKGGLIIVDNILWDGKVLDEVTRDEDTLELRICAQHAQNDERFKSTICSVGDGLLILEKL